MKFALMVVMLFLASCSTHYMSKSELVNEFKAGQDSIVIAKSDRPGFYILENSRGKSVVESHQLIKRVVDIVDSNGRVVLHGFKYGQRINVTNKSGDRVRIKVDQNSQLIINKKSDEKFQTYLVGTYLADELIYGNRSRILGTMRYVELGNINTVEVYSEFKTEEK